jgi:hypothetical protein
VRKKTKILGMNEQHTEVAKARSKVTVTARAGSGGNWSVRKIGDEEGGSCRGTGTVPRRLSKLSTVI